MALAKVFALTKNTPLLCICLVALLLCCQSATAAPRYSYTLADADTFTNLKAQPLGSQYAGVESVKIVYALGRERLYFVNSKRYSYHYSFCKDVLNYTSSLDTFNAHNYTLSPKRKYLLATLSYHPALDTYALELAPSDEMPLEQIQLLLTKLKHAFFAQHKLALLLNTSRLHLAAARLTHTATITPDALYKGQTYQLLTPGKAIGLLTEVDAASIDALNLPEHTLALINGTPLTVPPLAAIITTDFQTPLSHMAVLSRNRGTVTIAQKFAPQHEQIKPLIGSWVELVADANGFSLSPSSQQAYNQWRKRKTTKSITLSSNLNPSPLLDITELRYKDIERVGGKAANFAELQFVLTQLATSRLTNKTANAQPNIAAKAPEGAFAIPFYFYHQHIQQPAIQQALNAVLQLDGNSSDSHTLKQHLATLRDAIETAPLAPELVKAVEQRMVNGGFDRLRFRSSTNAEDLEGFSGAGLYTSKTGHLYKPKKNIERAIKKVWASTWRYAAYAERAYFGIEQHTVAMAVLAHRSFPNEIANGVAITRNLYRSDYPAFVINVQKGEESVVQPSPGVSVDQLISYRGVSDLTDEEGPPRYITYSSLNNGVPILTDEEIFTLTTVLDTLKKHFYHKVNKHHRRYKYQNFALDAEFKYMGPERVLYIKQARLFND